MALNERSCLVPTVSSRGISRNGMLKGSPIQSEIVSETQGRRCWCQDQGWGEDVASRHGEKRGFSRW